MTRVFSIIKALNAHTVSLGAAAPTAASQSAARIASRRAVVTLLVSVSCVSFFLSASSPESNASPPPVPRMLTTFAAQTSPVSLCVTAYTTLNPPFPMRRALVASYVSVNDEGLAFRESNGTSRARLVASNAPRTSSTSALKCDSWTSPVTSLSRSEGTFVSVCFTNSSLGAYFDETPGEAHSASAARDTQQPICLFF